MTTDTANEFSQDFASEIALECEKLESVLKLGLEEYDNSSSLLGKSWYAMGLESNDDDKNKDSENKKNILLRLVEKILNFIKTIGQKIASWFKACKAAIVKFFGDDKIDPKLVGERFTTLIDGLNSDDAALLVTKISQEGKTYLAELLNTEYAKTFSSLYQSFKVIKDKTDSVQKFSQNEEFFVHLKEMSGKLKTIATSGKIYDNVDESLKALLSGKNAESSIKEASAMFAEANSVHEAHIYKLERLLKNIPSEDLDGDNPDTKRRELVNLIADVIKIDGEVVLKANHYMQAIAMLMTYIVKYRLKKTVIIPM